MDYSKWFLMHPSNSSSTISYHIALYRHTCLCGEGLKTEIESHSRRNLENKLISVLFLSVYYKSDHLSWERYPVHSIAISGSINEGVL